MTMAIDMDRAIVPDGRVRFIAYLFVMRAL
jgi:hypothetical protein